MTQGFEKSSRLTPWQHLRRWLIGFVVCTLFALFLTSQYLFQPALRSNNDAWQPILLHSLLICYDWGILTLGIAAFTAKFGLDRQRWVRSVAIYLAAGIAFSIAHMIISSSVMWVISLVGGPSPHMRELSFFRLLGAIQSNLILFTMIASSCLALNYYRKFQDRELTATRLKTQLAQAQLDALKSQLQPHFLFNTLNGILVLVRENPAAAERMIVQLSDLLRSALDNRGHEEVTLSEELELIRRYLEIEQMRFGDRLVVEEKVAPETIHALVPMLILQPLVENSMRHGVSNLSTTCRVTISSERSNGRLNLAVIDSGPGTPNGEAKRAGGVGIANTVDRLRHLYGDQYEFSAGNQADGGFAVFVEFPFRESNEEDSGGEETE